MGNAQAPSHSHNIEVMKRAYVNLVAENRQVKEDLKETFKEVRILVVGKAGCGKTTLIRMLLGDKGPNNISNNGEAGIQDIKEEWNHPNLPLIFHDSNGIDSKGQARMDEITKFLGEHQAYESAANRFSLRVHAVWYVFSALDNRVKEDHGLLKMLDGYGIELPLLLIMTHHKAAETAYGEQQLETVTKQVLECISGDERRHRLRESMVRVVKHIEVDEDGKVVKDVDGDKPDLKLVVERTQSLMEQELWITWAACQGVNMKMKVEASVSLILEKRHHQWWASIFTGAIPGVSQGQVALMFTSLTHGLAKIWNASPNLEAAILSSKCFKEKRMSAVISNLGETAKVLALVAGAIAVAAGAGVVAAVAAPLLVESVRTEPSKHLLSYGLLVLSAIMYAHVHDLSKVEQGSVEHYSQQYEQFLGSPWAKEISDISKLYASMWAAGLHSDLPEEQRLVSEMVAFFNKMCVCDRATSSST